ncbi:protein kinase, putative, partial [Entamoeba invadens IP1]
YNNNTLKGEEEFGDESVTFGNTQISLFKTDNFVIGISAKDVVEMTIFALTKRVLFISETTVSVSNGLILFNAGYNTDGVLLPLPVIYCRSGVYNRTSKLCESQRECDDAYCIFCPTRKSECERCSNGYHVITGKCVVYSNCVLTKSNLCVKCSTGYSLENNLCNLEGKCFVTQIDGKCQICNSKMNYINSNGGCYSKDENSLITSDSVIVTCQKGYYINNDINNNNNTKCMKCTAKYEHSELCEEDKTIKCDSQSAMNLEGECENTNCENPNDLNGKCSIEIEKCLYMVNGKCKECVSGYVLYGGSCSIKEDENCEEQNSVGCLRCKDQFYYNKTTQLCETCSANCLTCYESSTFCLSCSDNKFLSSNKCVSIDELTDKCKQLAAFGSGCVRCVDGYYRNGLDCVHCDEKCSTCNTANGCFTCNLTNYKTNQGDCLPQNNIIGCHVEVTQSGCLQCEKGYYSVNGNECAKCESTCKTCSLTQTKCTSCEESLVLLLNGSCVGLSQIAKCKEVKESKCTKCEFWNSPNAEGTLCERKAVWWVVVLLVIFVVLILSGIVVLIIFGTKKVLEEMHQKNVSQTTTIFMMERSNVKFTALQNGICVSTREIDLNLENTEIPIEEETHQVFCVGNMSKNSVKIQISISAKVEKYY